MLSTVPWPGIELHHAIGDHHYWNNVRVEASRPCLSTETYNRCRAPGADARLKRRAWEILHLRDLAVVAYVIVVRMPASWG